MIRLRFLIWLAGAFVFLIALGYFFYGLQPVQTTQSEGESVSFSIKKGDSFRDIGARLSQDTLIRSLSVFKLYTILMGRAHTLKPGTYTLSSTYSVPELVHLLSRGGVSDVAVTIPEGVTVKDVDVLLTAAGITRAGAVTSLTPADFKDAYPFLDTLPSLEGFLFPDTYRFEPGTDASLVVEKMLNTFEEKAWPLLKGDPEWYGKLTIASFVEREVPAYEDRRKVADIILKRLDAGMPLQVDATVSYVNCNGAFLDCERPVVSREDTKEASPFNTYTSRGLTPTPIANPGESALKAVLNPVSTPYWYYLSAKETGKTIFSRTLDEHNRNRAKYL